MKITAQFPITITDKLIECKEFYVKYFHFSPVFEADWYIHLVHPSGVQLAVMRPELDNQPSFLHKPYPGEGVVYSFEVADAQAEFTRLEQMGVKIILPLKDEEWGQRHFILQDPAGVHIDIVEHLTK